MKVVAGDWSEGAPVFLDDSLGAGARELRFATSLFKADRLPVSAITSFEIITRDNLAGVAGALKLGRPNDRFMGICFNDGRKACVKGSVYEAELLAAATERRRF